MGKYGQSATEIGATLGVNGRVMNKVLELAGVYEQGEHGRQLTDFGEKFANVIDHDNGYGGYARRDWSTTHFDPSLLDELNITPDLIQQAKVEYAADLAAAALKRAASKEEAEALFQETQEKLARELQGAEVDWKKVALLVGGAIVVTGTAVVVVKYGPAIQRRWQEKVTPRIDAAKQKLRRSVREEKPAG